MTINEFKLIDPGSKYILALYSGSTITAINISTIDCLNRNIAQVLSKLSKIIVTLNGTLYTLSVVGSGESFTNHYHFQIDDTVITGIGDITEGVCINLTTVPPFIGGLFEKSEYQAVLNNADFARTTPQIFDVDRSNSQLKPSNYEPILSGSAVLASFQELNYTSIGLTNSRYAGAKTSRIDYGTISGISLDTFEGVVYNGNVDNDRICSQSLNSRESSKVTLGFSEEFNIGSTSPNGLPSYTKNTNRDLFSGYISGSAASPAALNNTETSIQVDWRRSEVSKLQVNGLYHFTTNSTEEFFILKSFSYLTSKTVDSIPLNTYNMVVERGAEGGANSHTADNVTYFNINIKKVESSQIFQFDGNKINTLSNRKIYLPLTDIVVEVGKNGMVYSGSLACT